MKKIAFVHFTVLIASCFLLHSANYQHAYQLDSPDGLVSNPYVRSLTYIPRYFRDPSTLTSLRQNWDYRPVLQITYAVNYAISQYNIWSWHLTQIILHVICVIGLYVVCRKMLTIYRPAENAALTANLPFVAALLFAVHPYTSGTINYLWARSSLLVGALLFSSLSLYMKPKSSANYVKTPWGALILYTLALFAKVEAVAALGVYWLFEIIRQPFGQSEVTAGQSIQDRFRFLGDGFLQDVLRSFNTITLKRLWPFLAVTIVYAGIRTSVVPDFLAKARHAGDVTPYIYFCTQLTAWWHYVLQWFAPVRLVADNLAYPIFRSLLAPEVLLALTGWCLVGILLKAAYLKHPEYMFIGLSALALISPHSSIAPLTEMVNEHRPYMPLAMLSLAWILLFGDIFSKYLASKRFTRSWLLATLCLSVATLSLLTWERNKVYKTAETYWEDVLKKAPSSRAHLNYGLVQMQKGRLQESLAHFQTALTFAPRWHIIHINLGINYEALGKRDLALEHYHQAVENERYGSQSLLYRAKFYLKTTQYALAAADFQRSLELTTTPYEVYKGLATAHAGSGSWQKAAEDTEHLCQLDPRQCEYDILEIARPFWDQEALYAAGIEYYRAIAEFLPERWWIYQNIGTLAQRLNQKEFAQESFQKATTLQNTDEN